MLVAGPRDWHVLRFFFADSHFQYNGKGVLVCSTWTYFGDFNGGLMHGNGVMKWLDGLKEYNGQWKSGQITGAGECFAPVFLVNKIQAGS